MNALSAVSEAMPAPKTRRDFHIRDPELGDAFALALRSGDELAYKTFRTAALAR
jgi:hypothetical protein